MLIGLTRHLQPARTLKRLQTLASQVDPLGALIHWLAPASYRQARRHIVAGREAQATALLEALCTEKHGFAPAHFQLGLLSLKSEQWQRAYEHMQTATRLWPLRRRWHKHAERSKQLHLLYVAYRPEVVLYVSGMENVAYQANMWIPVLERLDARAAIVIRERGTAADLIPTRLPVLHLPGMRDLEHLSTCGTQTLLYPGNAQKNIHSLRLYRLNHYFINHGESDKIVNQTKFLMAYDKLLVAGPLAEERMKQAGLPLRPGQVVHVGRPTVELLLKKTYGHPRAIKRVLYAPTWEGFAEEANYTSVTKLGLEMLQALTCLKDTLQLPFSITFKPHPFTGSQNPATRRALKAITSYCKAAGIGLLAGTDSIYPAMNDADLLITDISSTINDFLYTEKPIVLTDPKRLGEEAMIQAFPSSRATYLLGSASQLPALLEHIITTDSKHSLRLETALHTLGNLPQGAMKTFNEVINQSLVASHP